MSKKLAKEDMHVTISWASGFVDKDTTVATLQSISRDVEKLYKKQTGKTIQITTIIRGTQEKE